MAELRMSPVALEELEEALQWYSKRSVAAASKFASAVDAALDVVEANPLRYAALNSRYRHARVKGFPYYLAYRIVGDYVAIASVRHTSRGDSEFEPLT